MRMTELFGRTLREAPADAEGLGYQLLQRAGYVRSAGGNRYTYLPLGQAALERLAAALAPHSDGRAPARFDLPAVAGTDLLALARSLAGAGIQSYRQLPVRGFARGVWQRERSQGRGGPLAAREGPALFALSMDGTEEAAGRGLPRMAEATRSPSVPAAGLTSSSPATRPRPPRPTPTCTCLTTAPDSALLCDGCGYAALAGAARFARPPVANRRGPAPRKGPDPAHRHHRGPGCPPRRARIAHGQGRLPDSIAGGRRAVRLRGRPRRHGPQRAQAQGRAAFARQARRSVPPRNRGRDPRDRRRRPATRRRSGLKNVLVVVDDLVVAVAQSRRGGERRRLPPAQHQLRPRLPRARS